MQGQPVDPRSDIYSFGVSSYHMLAGEPPFKGETPFEVALQHVQKEPEALGDIRPDLPAELCAIVHRMMNKRPEDRYQTAREILRDLTRLKEGLSISVGRAALSQSGSSESSGVPLSLSSTLADGSQPVPMARSRWRQWLVVAASFLCAGSVGAAIHWKTSPPLERKLVVTELPASESIPNPARAIEKELQKRLKEHGIKSDLEVTNALLELAALYTQEKRYKEALQLFEMTHLREWPALVEAQKTFQFPGLYFQMLSHLGKGIVLAQTDLPDDSNTEFKNALLAKGKVALKQPVDLFLWKYDRWKKAVADALERNSKNKNGAKLEESLNRYRHYSKAS